MRDREQIAMSIDEQLPPEDCAVAFHQDGSFSIMMPKSFSDPGDKPVSQYVIAATELAMRLMEGDLTVGELVEAFNQRRHN